MVGSVAARAGRRRCRKSAAGELAGRTENNRIVNFPARRTLVGQFVDVRITAALSHSLRGELP